MIKKQLLFIVIAICSITSCNTQFSYNPEKWSEKKLEKWFRTGEWKSGWKIAPDESINKKEFACQYFRNKDRWNKAFDFLSTTDLSKIELGRHELDGNNLYVNVDEYTTKNEEDSRFEAHRECIDIQYLVYGEEKIGIAPLSNTTEVTAYDSLKDITFLNSEQNNYHVAFPDRFFVFFPEDAHRPCVKTNENLKVRKIVVKIKIK